MTDDPANLVLEQLRIIRADIGNLRAETSLKIGSLAEGMVSMRRDINDMGKQVNDMGKRIGDLGDIVQGLRIDMRMIALAVDEHTARLDRIDARLSLHDA